MAIMILGSMVIMILGSMAIVALGVMVGVATGVATGAIHIIILTGTVGAGQVMWQVLLLPCVEAIRERLAIMIVLIMLALPVVAIATIVVA